MTGSLTLNRHAHALERTYSYEEQRRHGHDEATARVAHGLTIALAREFGTPAEEVARAVGTRLGWRVYDHELLDEVARCSGIPVTALEQIDEKPQSWWLELLEGFASSRKLTGTQYVHHLRRVLWALGSEGSCVILGRGAAQFLPAHSTLRVRLVGTLQDRAARLSRLEHISQEEEARRLEERSREREHFIKQHFHKDPAPSDNYDLILNTTEWPVARCADLILQALKMKAEAHPELASPYSH